MPLLTLICQGLISFFLGVWLFSQSTWILGSFGMHSELLDRYDNYTFQATNNTVDISNLEEDIALTKKDEALRVLEKKINKEDLSNNFSIVDLSEQRNYLFKDGRFYTWYKVATGGFLSYDYDARLWADVWKIRAEQYDGLAPIYGDCILHLNVRSGDQWVHTNRALHGTNTPDIIGTPKSLGCVYHYNEDILEVCEILGKGDIVITIE